MGASESNENAPSSMESDQLGLGSDTSPPPPPPLPPPTADAVESLVGGLQNLGLNESDSTDADPAEADPSKQKDSKTGGRHYRHPVRPREPDCSFYLRTGTCRFGLNCRFNHPPRKNKDKKKGRENENEKEKEEEKPDQVDCKAGDDSDKDIENEDKAEKEKAKSEKLECKYYLQSGGCKFGKACRYNHSRERAAEEEQLELNFLGLPIRLGERECPYYMRTGSCKFGTNCRFHHPDPTAPGGSDPLFGFHNDSSIPLHPSAASQTPAVMWSSHGASNEPILYTDTSPPYVPMMPSLPQVAHPNPEWSGFQAPRVNPLPPMERNVLLPSASVVSNSGNKTESYNHQLKPPVEEFPERPGQPDCQYFLRNGGCKFKSACRFNHPKTGISKSSTHAVSPMGLPLRPGQPICIHYRRHGICKSGPSCKFDHPINNGSLDSSASSALPGGPS